MRKTIVILLLSCLFSACAARQEVSPTPVYIPDPALAAVLSAAAGAPADQLTTTALRKITKLDASAKGIQNLAGLENCTRMFDLDLSQNDLTDIGPLAGLRGLVMLNLSFNRISDLTPLSSLFSLSEINLISNQVSDISPLSRNCQGGGIPEGTRIRLQNNPLSKQAMDVDLPYLINEGAVITVSKNIVPPAPRLIPLPKRPESRPPGDAPNPGPLR